MTWDFYRLTDAAELEGVLELDAVCFNHPWSRADYERELADPSRCFIVVARSPGLPVAAYCSFWRIFDEIHINNFAVRPDHRGQGLGKALLQHVLAEGRAMGAPKVTLEVRRSNEPAIRLYERAGFQRLGIRRQYYATPLEDALILWFEPGASVS